MHTWRRSWRWLKRHQAESLLPVSPTVPPLPLFHNLLHRHSLLFLPSPPSPHSGGLRHLLIEAHLTSAPRKAIEAEAPWSEGSSSEIGGETATKASPSPEACRGKFELAPPFRSRFFEPNATMTLFESSGGSGGSGGMGKKNNPWIWMWIWIWMWMWIYEWVNESKFGLSVIECSLLNEGVSESLC